MTEVLTYEALKAKCDRLEQINAQTLQVKLTMAETIKELTDRVERLSGMLTESRVATKSAEERADALALENQVLKAAGNKMFLSAISLMEDPELKIDHSRDIKDWERNETPATDAALAAIQAQAKAEAIEQLAIQLEQLPDDAFEFLSDVAEFETYQEEHHTFVSISNPRAVANAVLSLVKEQSTDPREAK
ncbi:hypothetical protein [Serratia marcescens]|uniref:hypothetical protein n=1 Tax=Serratia marcescens TaxID=615 RepID=UPI0039671F32